MEGNNRAASMERKEEGEKGGSRTMEPVTATQWPHCFQLDIISWREWQVTLCEEAIFRARLCVGLRWSSPPAPAAKPLFSSLCLFSTDPPPPPPPPPSLPCQKKKKKRKHKIVWVVMAVVLVTSSVLRHLVISAIPQYRY